MYIFAFQLVGFVIATTNGLNKNLPLHSSISYFKNFFVKRMIFESATN